MTEPKNLMERRDFIRLAGTGLPSQVCAVSHGRATSRFEGIKVINTRRKL